MKIVNYCMSLFQKKEWLLNLVLHAQRIPSQIHGGFQKLRGKVENLFA